MSAEPLNRPVRVLLLDNVWPYDSSANLLRLHVLRLLLRRLHVKASGDTIDGLFQAFDLVVARDSPFIRQFCRILNSSVENFSWSNNFYPIADNTFEIDDDVQFKGFQWDAQREILRALRNHPSNKILMLHTHTSRYRIERSYIVNDDHHQMITHRLELLDLDLYTEALSSERLRLPGHSVQAPEFFPLIILAKLEAQLLYPNHGIVIVELNSLLGRSSNASQFVEWFGETRGEEVVSKLRRTLAPKPSKALRAEAKLLGELALQTKISKFRKALLNALITNMGYMPSDLEGVRYYNLGFDPRQLLKSRSIGALQLMMQNLSDSRRLWESITACMRGLELAPSMAPGGPVIRYRRPLRLLGFDGGGVRGLSSLLILQKVLEKVKRSFHLSATPLPCEYFDMIAGTSTGGLIAILLGRLRLSINECINLYENVAQDIFGVEQPITASTRFSSQKFRDVLKKRIRDILAVNHDETYLQDPKVAAGNGCPIFVVTIDRDRVAEPEGAILLRSYEAEGGVSFEESCYLWEAALATCSAPIFFSPAQVKDKVLVDGGLGHNNPTEHLIDEAKRRWPDRQIGAVVSIGTGKARGNLLARDMKRSAAGKHPVALIHVAKVLKHIATSSEARERSVFNLFRGMNRLDCYFRFNVDTGMEIELHEYKKYGEIRLHTSKYLDNPRVKELLIACAKKLEAKDGEVAQSFPSVPTMRNDYENRAQASSDVKDQLTDENEARNSSESVGLQQLVNFSSPIIVHLNPLYQLDALPLPARITPLEDISKVPIEAIVEQKALDWGSTKRRQANIGEAQLMSGIAYAIDTNLSETRIVLDYKESGLERKIEPGLWRLHWLLLFHRLDIGFDGVETEEDEIYSHKNVPKPVGDSLDPSTAPKPAQVQLSVHYESEDGKSVGLNTAAVLGADIPYPAPSFLDEQWQAIAMDDLLELEPMSQQPNLRFCLDFAGWDEATSRAGTKHTWTIYFGGIRMTPVNEANA